MYLNVHLQTEFLLAKSDNQINDQIRYLNSSNTHARVMLVFTVLLFHM